MPFFNLLREELARSSIDLDVAFGRARRREVPRADTAELEWGTAVASRYFPVGRHFAVWLKIRKERLAGASLVVFPHESSLLLNFLPLLARNKRGRGVALWGHGSTLARSSWGDLSASLRRWSALRAHWWFAYTRLSAEQVVRLGFPSERVTCVDNAVDMRALARWRAELTADERAGLQRALGLRGEHVAVCLGSLTKEKRPGVLFRVADKVRSALPSFELIIIGDGPRRGFVEREAGCRPWVRWVGSKHGREKLLYASLGKILLNPGMVGLVVLDSFALGLPLLTVEADIHSPEIAYLENGRNAKIVRDDVEALAEAAVSLLTDEEERLRLATACLRDSAKYSIEKMVALFAQGVRSALAN